MAVRAQHRHRELLVQLGMFDPSMRDRLANLNPSVNETMSMEEVQGLPTRVWHKGDVENRNWSGKAAEPDSATELSTAQTVPVSLSRTTSAGAGTSAATWTEAADAADPVILTPGTRPLRPHSLFMPTSPPIAVSRPPSVRSVRTVRSMGAALRPISVGLFRKKSGDEVELGSVSENANVVDDAGDGQALCAICLEAVSEM
ncbi:hypothetical protein HDU93_001153 [Gonapodya sp. JEL0774]|nr:hypothetical protein HDU93_001153 [Gonapodya sp. JEL0774]